MKNTKLNFKAFSRLVIFSLLFSGSLSSGDASSCDIIAKAPNSSVEDVMNGCLGGFESIDGCRITLEKACVNGVEVSLPGDLHLHKLGLGIGLLFKGVEGQGLSGKDFSQAQKKELNEKMYGTYKTPGGKPYQLCSKVPGLKVTEGGQLDLSQLPDGYVIESVPAIINPKQDVALTTLHWRLQMKTDWRLQMKNRKPEYSVEIRYLMDPDNNAGIGRGSSFLEVIKDLSASKQVRCKASGSANQLKFLNNDDKKKAAQLYVDIMSKLSNSGLNTAQLAGNMHSILGLSGSSDDAIATFQRAEGERNKIRLGLGDSQQQGKTTIR